MNNGPLFLVDSDADDRIIVKELFAELNLPNAVFYFGDGQQLLDYLQTEHVPPFIILSDVNLPGSMDGFKLRQKVVDMKDSHYDGVPFIFWSTAASEAQVLKAYQLGSHGFFKKPLTFRDMKISFLRIVNYWSESLLPPGD